MKKIIISIVVFTLLTMGTALAAPVVHSGNQSGDIGCVNVEKIMHESTKLKAFQTELDQKAKELASGLEADKVTLSVADFNKKSAQVYSDFTKMKDELENKVDTLMNQAFEKVTKERKLSVIVNKNSIVWGSVDVTADVISAIEQ